MLHDVDSHSFDRSSPMPNHKDQLANGSIKHHGTNSVNYVTDATDSTTNSPIRYGFARMVYSDNVTVTNDGVHNNNTVTYPHPLGYAPMVMWSLNNASVGGLTNVNVINPTLIGFSISGATWVPYLVLLVSADASNVYVQLFDAALDSASVTVTFYLYQQTATGG